MNSKLKYFALSLATTIMVIALSGCKKGENDPFLSLRSRTARITGEWKLQEGNITTDSNFGGIPETSTTTYTETTCTNNGVTVSYSETLIIEEDGTYSIDIKEDGLDYKITGVWFFAGKVKDLGIKNKEAITLVEQSMSEPGFSYTLNGLLSGEPFLIDQLKNEEMIFKGETTYDTGSGNFGSTTTYERKFAKQ